jgi:small nuclear ribonucleoprotein (snRNP)-like protein
VEGVLKGYDQLLNLVLDDCIEFLQGAASDLLAFVFDSRPRIIPFKTSCSAAEHAEMSL